MNGLRPIEVPVVAFPLRGRINPYFWWLIPLFGLALAAALLSLGSLIAVCLAAVGKEGWDAEPGIYQAGTIVAIIIYSLTLALCIVICTSYGFTFFNLLDTKFTQIIVDVSIDLLIILKGR